MNPSGGMRTVTIVVPRSTAFAAAALFATLVSANAETPFEPGNLNRLPGDIVTCSQTFAMAARSTEHNVAEMRR